MLQRKDRRAAVSTLPNGTAYPVSHRLTVVLEQFEPDLYVADGPPVSFMGFAYPMRMAVVRLSNGASEIIEQALGWM